MEVAHAFLALSRMRSGIGQQYGFSMPSVEGLYADTP